MKKISSSENNPGTDIRKVDWNEYYKNKSNQTPRETLITALEYISKNKNKRKDLFAVDVGCGHGADTIELLKQGWKVFATDGDENGLRILNESVDDSHKKNLITKKISFENYGNIRIKKCDLLNAGYCLPFCKPQHFNVFWENISGFIKKGGVFSGQFFGENDEWTYNKEMTFHNLKAVKKLFTNFKIIYFEEKDEDGKTASGESKHWHVFSVTAEKSV